MAAAAAVADTHVLLWYVAGRPLTLPAQDVLDGATAAGEPIYVSAISLLELVYLAESGRLTEAQVGLVDAALHAEDSAFEIYPVDEDVARAVADIPRTEVPNPQERTGRPGPAVTTAGFVCSIAPGPTPRTPSAARLEYLCVGIRRTGTSDELSGGLWTRSGPRRRARGL